MEALRLGRSGLPLRPREDDRVRTSRGAGRLPKRTERKEPPVPERPFGVEEENIGILRERNRVVGIVEEEVIGICSLLIWTLILIVTLKYVVLILRADNRGEGGTLSLLAVAGTWLTMRRAAVR